MNTSTNSAMSSAAGRRKLFKDEREAREFVGACGLGWIGSSVSCFDQIDSTNTQARKLAGLGRPDGTLVLAEYQTRGRGRLGRKWVCPWGAGLLVSVLVDRSHCGRSGTQWHVMPHWLAAAGALAMARAAGDSCGGEVPPKVLIEWPNDLVAVARDEGEDATRRHGDKGHGPRGTVPFIPTRARKLGGVLVEGEHNSCTLVLGVGLNVDTRLDEFPPEIARTAGSLLTVFGVALDRRDVLGRFLRGLEERLADAQGLQAELRERSATLGREVTIELSGRPRRARAIGFDEEMRLVVELPGGRIEAVASAGTLGSASRHDALSRGMWCNVERGQD